MAAFPHHGTTLIISGARSQTTSCPYRDTIRTISASRSTEKLRTIPPVGSSLILSNYGLAFGEFLVALWAGDVSAVEEPRAACVMRVARHKPYMSIFDVFRKKKAEFDSRLFGKWGLRPLATLTVSKGLLSDCRTDSSLV